MRLTQQFSESLVSGGYFIVGNAENLLEPEMADLKRCLTVYTSGLDLRGLEIEARKRVMDRSSLVGELLAHT